VPLSIGNAPLSVVATRDLGGLGPNETPPVLVDWRWYYHLPGLAIWILVAGLLVLVKENRNWQAWTILIPALLLTKVAWPLIDHSAPAAVHSIYCFAFSGTEADIPFNFLIGAWTAIWLMAPWLARCRPRVAFSLALAFLLLSGAIAHVCEFSDSLWRAPSLLWWCRYVLRPTLWYGTCAAAMLLGMTLGATHCRDGYRPGRFVMWTALGCLAAAIIGTLLYLSTMYPELSERILSPSERILGLRFILRVSAASFGVAAFVFLVNLPFLCLAHFCPLYRDRLRKALRIPDSEHCALGGTP
jgi:hypothetical protein